jgi:hypothetical protein
MVKSLYVRPTRLEYWTITYTIQLCSKVEEQSGDKVWYLLPKREGRAMAAGPGPLNSAAMGPRRLWGVQFRDCPPMLHTTNQQK